MPIPGHELSRRTRRDSSAGANRSRRSRVVAPARPPLAAPGLSPTRSRPRRRVENAPPRPSACAGAYNLHRHHALPPLCAERLTYLPEPLPPRLATPGPSRHDAAAAAARGEGNDGVGAHGSWWRIPARAPRRRLVRSLVAIRELPVDPACRRAELVERI